MTFDKYDIQIYMTFLYKYTSFMSRFDSYVRSTNYALLAITKLPNNELTGIHILSLPPLLF